MLRFSSTWTQRLLNVYSLESKKINENKMQATTPSRKTVSLGIFQGYHCGLRLMILLSSSSPSAYIPDRICRSLTVIDHTHFPKIHGVL